LRLAYPWILTITLAFSPLVAARASVDDTVEQIEDATDDPLDPPTVLAKGLKFPPVRLTLQEEIEWGDFSGTDVTTFRTTANAEARFALSRKFVGAISTRYGITATDFDGDKDFYDVPSSSGSPWNELHEFNLRLRTQYLVTDSWGVVLSSWMTSRFEDGATFEDGVKGAGAVGVAYRHGDQFGLVAGVAVSSRIVGSPVAVNPFGSAYWNIDERHRLSTSGLGLRLRSRWTDSISTYLYGRFKGRRWRLDDREDGLVNRGSLRDRRVPIGIGVQWKFLEGWRLRTDLGLVAYRVIKVTNEDDDSVSTETANGPGVFGSFMLQRRF